MSSWERSELLAPGFFASFTGGLANFDAQEDFTITNTISNGDCVVTFQNPIKDYQWLEIEVQALSTSGELSAVSFYRDMQGLSGPLESFGAQIYGQGITTFVVPFVGTLEGFKWSNIYGTIKIHSLRAVRRNPAIQLYDDASVTGDFLGWTTTGAAGSYYKDLPASALVALPVTFSLLAQDYCYVKVEVDKAFSNVATTLKGQNCNSNAQVQEFYFDTNEISPKNISITAGPDIGCRVTVTLKRATFPVGLSAFGAGTPAIVQAGGAPGTGNSNVLLGTPNTWTGFNSFMASVAFNGVGYVKANGANNPITFSPTIPNTDITGLGTMATQDTAVWAPKNSPALTGVPTAPTPAGGDNSTKLATTAFVQTAIALSIVTSFNTRTGAVVLTTGDVTGALGFTPYNNTNPAGYISGITSLMVTTALGFTPYNNTNPNGYISGITSGMVTAALGFTPYNNTNPAGYISGITSLMVTTALGFTPYNSTNPNGYISGITKATINTALQNVAATGATNIVIGGSTTKWTNAAMTNTSGYLIYGIEGAAGAEVVPGTAAYSSFIGSNTNQPFHLIQNALVRATINATGLGVGITPDEKLHVSGAIHLEPGVPGTTTARLYNNSGVLTWNGVVLATGSAVSGTITKIPKFTAANALGDSVMAETSTGNVGVGAAATVNERMSINGGASFAIALRINQGWLGQNGLTFSELGTNKWTIYTDAGFRLYDETGGVDSLIIDASHNIKAIQGAAVGVQRDSDGALISQIYGDLSGPGGSSLGRWEVAGGGTPEADIRVNGVDVFKINSINTNVSGELIANPGYANVKQFGAKGDFVESTSTGTDDTAAIQAAINAAGYDGVYFPKGYYKITSQLNCGPGKSLAMVGDGPNHSTLCLIGAGTLLRFTGVRNDRNVDTLVVRNLRFSAATAIAQYAIYASWTNGGSVSQLNTFHHAIIENCHFGQGLQSGAFTYGVRLDGGKDSRIHNCMFNNFIWAGGVGTLNGMVSNGIGVYLSASTGESGVTDIDISKCIFDKTYTGVYGVNKLEGIRVYDCSFVGGLQGVVIDLTDHTAGGPYVNIDRNHFQTSEYGISLSGCMQSMITNNLIYSFNFQTGHNAYWGIQLVAKAAVYSSDITIANNVFLRGDPTSFATGYAIGCLGNSGTNLLKKITIHNNRFGNGFNWSQSMYLDAFTSDITALNNISDIGDSWLDNGTNNVVIPRIEVGAANSGGAGYRMLRSLN